jgi:NTE family protein
MAAIMDLFRRRRSKKIGLALSGGAVLGAAHVGALRAMDEHGLQIDAVAGTSIGAFVGALLAFGKSWREIGDIAAELDWFDISRFAPSRYGLLSNEKMGALLREVLGEVTFDQARIPFYAVATDAATGETVVLEDGRVDQAVMASTCIPGVFSPVTINGRMLIDGGVVENIPVSPLEKRKGRPIVSIDLIANASRRSPDHVIDIMLNVFYFSSISSARHQTRGVDVPIDLDLSNYSMVNTDQIEELIAEGYRQTLPVLGRSFR